VRLNSKTPLLHLEKMKEVQKIILICCLLAVFGVPFSCAVNYVGEEGAGRLAESLKHNTTLTLLDLEGLEEKAMASYVKRKHEVTL